MSERPVKLPFSATLVVRASEVLTLAEKLVWLEDHAFDRGPDGAYVSAASLAARWGGSLAPKTVELARSRLRLLGLHDKIARPGARNIYGWFAVLPPGCAPVRERTTPDEVARLARRLDEHIARIGDPRLERGQGPAPPGARPLPPQGSDPRRDSGLGAAALGGRGETPSSSGKSESSFPPAVSRDKQQDGIGSYEPEREDGGRRSQPSRARDGIPRTPSTLRDLLPGATPKVRPA